MAVDFCLPTGWAELTQKQLRFVYSLIAADYSLDEVKTLTLLKWNGCKVIARDNGGFVLQKGKTVFSVKPIQITEATQSLDWLAELPPYPVRLERISRCQAVAADFQGVPFESYIIVENLYQGFLTTRNEEMLDEIGKVLYPKPSPLFTLHTPLSAMERIAVFYWVASLKQMLARQFPDFFQPMPESGGNLLGGSPNIGAQLQECMDAQIRALTKGDITKESEILSLDTWRALTELNAQAREYRQINSKYNAK